ncbi:hypothetical protein JXA84_02605 [candidate division WOR-3 bacterium]|nr:hypothetical protein [candidate division WOR-3 bacterium]
MAFYGKISCPKKKIDLAKIAFYESLLLDPDSPSYNEIRVYGLPEDKFFVRNSDPDKLISHIMRKVEVLEEREDNKKRPVKKNWQDLPLPPPPEDFLEKTKQLEAESKIPEAEDEKLDEILKDLEPDFSFQEKETPPVEIGKLTEIEEANQPVKSGLNKEALDVIVRTLKEEKKSADIDLSDCENQIKSMLERKIIIYILMERGSVFYENGDKTFSDLVRGAVENVKSLSMDKPYWSAEFEDEAILGFIDKDFSATALCEKKKTGLVKIEMTKIHEMAREKL